MTTDQIKALKSELRQQIIAEMELQREMEYRFSIPGHLLREASIQAEFYMCCRQIRLNVALETSTPKGRLDAAIFTDDWEWLIAIVECKRDENFRRYQISRYKDIGVPVFGLCEMSRCMPLAKQIKRDYLINGSGGKTWEDVQKLPLYFKPNRRGRGLERYKRQQLALAAERQKIGL